MSVPEQSPLTLCGSLEGHTDWVTAIACPATPDSNIVVSASRDKQVLIWELTKNAEAYGVLKKSLPAGHSHFIQDLTLSSDGQYALTASWDKTLLLWNLTKCQTEARFVGHTNDVMSVTLSPDNRQIVSGSRDKTIKVWNIKGQCKFDLTQDGHTEWVSCTRFSPNPNNNLMVSCGWDKVVKVWDMNNSCKLSVNHFGHTRYVNTTKISPDGSLCASGGRDGKVMLWDLNERQHLYNLDVGDEIFVLVFSPMRYWLAAATASCIKIWDLESKSIVEELRIEDPYRTKSALPKVCISLAWSADGTTLFGGYTDNMIHVWKVNIVNNNNQ